MKLFTSFWAGALAGYLVGSTKQGMKMRGELENCIHGFFGKQSEKAESDSLDQENARDDDALSGENKDDEGEEENNDNDEDQENAAQPGQKKSGLKEDQPAAPAKEKGLKLEQAKLLAEKLGAKVSEPEGEQAIPYAHPIETSTSRLSA